MNTNTVTPTVGQILSSSWGYEQTNVDFYQVIKVSASQVTIKEIHSEHVSEDGFMTGKVMPLPNVFKEEEKEIRRKFRSYSKDNYSVSVTSYKYASLWNGKPERYSSYY
jgi:hypothetical protein